jgi:ribulose-bisphosphate carboxylase large chain
MRDHRTIRATYYLESEIEPERAAAAMAGEQSSGTFVAVPGESPELHERHGAQVVGIEPLGDCQPSLPSRTSPEKVQAALVTVDFPMETVGTDLATLQTAVAGNLFELGQLYACRLQDIRLPDEFVAAHPGPAFGIPGTRRLINGVEGVMIGTIVKPNVGLHEDEFRQVVRELALASIDLIKDDELMTDPGYQIGRASCRERV